MSSRCLTVTLQEWHDWVIFTDKETEAPKLELFPWRSHTLKLLGNAQSCFVNLKNPWVSRDVPEITISRNLKSQYILKLG